VKELEKQMGLDQPAWVQYGRYIGGILHGDLGESSSTGRPVLEDFKQRLPATLELTLASLLIALVLGIPLGVQSAVHRDTAIDHIGRIVGVAGVAMPTFWTGLLLLYVFFYLLGVAPAPLGRLGPGIDPPHAITGLYVVDSLLTGNWSALGSALQQLILPSLTLGLSVMAPIARMVRSTMLEILESDYVKAAWAAGIPRRRVIYGDALANAMIPVVTILGIVFGFLMAGNAVVESVFAWPGIGNYAITALMTKDSGPIQSFVLFVALLYVIVNFVVDLLYGLIDPRIRLE
ncbi:MAG TPA: ABC transporter permease, partial [Reyranella sp.]|nr:ABC transporter permease [Reyranella sp.]